MEDNLGTKSCSNCGGEYPLSLEYWYKNKRAKSGCSTYCKTCTKARSNKNYYDNIEDRKERRTKNKEKLARYNKQYKKDNKEKLARYHKQYKKDNKEKIAEQQKEYKAKNKEKIARYKEQYYQSEQGRKNKVKSNQNRRAKKAQLPNTLTTEEYEDNLKYFNHSCAYCGCELDEDNHHIEHVYPISRGVYGTTKENCIPSCDSCNLSKGPKTIAEWYVWTEDYSFERLLKIHEITSGGKEWVINQKEHTNK